MTGSGNREYKYTGYIPPSMSLSSEYCTYGVTKTAFVEGAIGGLLYVAGTVKPYAADGSSWRNGFPLLSIFMVSNG